MLERFFKKKASILDEPIAEVLNEMNGSDPETDGYSRLIDHLDRLMRMKQQDSRFRISPDVMAIVGGNLLGILIIVAYEQKHVMVSKGLGLILKPHH